MESWRNIVFFLEAIWVNLGHFEANVSCFVARIFGICSTCFFFLSCFHVSSIWFYFFVSS